MKKLTEGMNKGDICKMYNVALRTVYSILKNGNSRSPPGKRLRRTRASKEIILKAVKSLKKNNNRVSCKKIANKMVIPLSRSTIRRNLMSMGYKYVPSTYSIILNDSQKKVRVDLVRCYITERIDFHKIVFTDESRFTLDGNNSNKT